jgi:uncharacterized RDD family membrane protein YckC
MNSTPNPFAPPTATVSDKPDESDRRASRGARLGARILDAIIYGVVFWTPMLAMGGNVQTLTAGGGNSAFKIYANLSNSSAGPIVGLLFLVLFAINLTLLYRSGQTIGKKLVGIHIRRSDGTRAALARIFFVRGLPFNIIAFVPFIGFIVSLADPLFIFSESRKCLHDRLADTIVLTE